MSRLYSNLHIFKKPNKKTVFAVCGIAAITCLLVFLRCDAEFCVSRARLTYVWQPENILAIEPYNFLSDFKNPCWFENLTDPDPYKLELGGYNARMKNMFRNLTERWRRRKLEQGRTQRLRCLPYFYVAGMPKCGTTDLFWKINMHPQVVRPPNKEPHWWTRVRFNGKSRPRTLEEYVDFYDGAADVIWRNGEIVNTTNGEAWRHRFITGEGSASTLWDNRNWRRLAAVEGSPIVGEPKHITADYIKHLQPNAKIIVILRDPTTRLYSDYLYFSHFNKSAADFHEKVVKAIKVYSNCVHNRSARSCLYDATIIAKFEVRLHIGLYVEYLQDWAQIFPLDQIQVIRLEDHSANPVKSLGRVMKFIGLDPLPEEMMEEISGSKPFNARKRKDKLRGPMWDKTNKILREFHKTYNQQLSNMLGDDGYLWEENA